MISNAAKNFDVLAINLNILIYHYFVNPIKLFLDLAKFLDYFRFLDFTLAKPFSKNVPSVYIYIYISDRG